MSQHIILLDLTNPENLILVAGTNGLFLQHSIFSLLLALPSLELKHSSRTRILKLCFKT
jgi:hypothetical protein